MAHGWTRPSKHNVGQSFVCKQGLYAQLSRDEFNLLSNLFVQMSSDLIYMETFHTLAMKMTYYFISSFVKNAKKKRSSNELQASSATGKLQFYLVL